MKVVMTPEILGRLSTLLDEALDLDEPAREAWLAALGDRDIELAPTLRKLLARRLLPETGDLLDRGPEFTALGAGDQASNRCLGDTIGPYRLLRELGRGGMGEVWLAERSDGVLKRAVALKLPHSALPQRQLAERLARERDILAALTHPHIARLYDAGVTPQGQPYLALEYVEGEPLLAWCDRRRLGLRERVELYLQVLAAVQYAHTQLVVHRDLKPSNILVTPDGEVKLLDFGIAKLLIEGQAKETELTQLGGRALTPQYASPEQLTGNAIGTASDVYSLGVLLYELLCGTLPYRLKRDSRVALEEAILSVEPARPSQADIDDTKAKARGTTTKKVRRALSGDLDTIVLKALKKAPQERYPTVQALSEDLRRFLEGEAVLAQPDSTLYRARKFVGRHRLGSVAGGIAVLALVGFTISLNMQVHKVTRERDRADRIAQFMAQIFKVSDPNEGRAGTVTARELLDSASKEIESGLTDDPELRAQLVRTMGRAYTMLGAFDRSETLLRREYERAGATLGADDPQTLLLGWELAWLLEMKFQPVAAEALARDVLERQRRTLGPDHPQTLNTESHLAGVLGSLGRFDEAIALLRHSIETNRRQAKPGDIGLLDEEASLAFYMARSKKSDHHEAEKIFRDVVDGYRAKLGAGNLKTLTAISSLANYLDLEKKYDEEESLLRAAIDEGGRTLGPEHPRVRDLVNNLAATLINKGDLEKAEPMLRESLAINARVNGPDSPRAATAKYNLACLLARRGNTEEALTYLADAIDHGLIPDAALEMEHEDDLKSLRGELRFKSLVALVKARYAK
jgi:serine/threonine protein kinase